MKNINTKITITGLFDAFEKLLMTIMIMGGGYITISLVIGKSLLWAVGWLLACSIMGYVFIGKPSKY